MKTTSLFLFVLFFSITSHAKCFKKYSETPLEKIETFVPGGLIGTIYGCYKQDLSPGTKYIPQKNCMDQSKKKKGQYDVRYDIVLKEDRLYITVNDPFIGKARSSKVIKICLSEKELIVKTHPLNIHIYKNEQDALELSFRFFFKTYYQLIKKA